MVELSNQYLTVNLHPKGAEIISIVGNQDHINYMWKRDACQWANSAPILFPIVGAIKNDTCRIDGKEYHMIQHGFARHNEFEIKNQSQTEVTFTLVSNDEIIKQYPFLFELNVTYKLVENTLTCFINVKNKDHQTIYFQVGGHPAFACPFMENESSNDYYVEFSEYETRNQKVIDVAKRGMSHVQLPFFDHEKRFFVRQQLFNNDAIVIKDFKSENISIKSLNHQKSIVFHMQGFDHVGLWTAKHVGGLLAIEPWVGHADYVDFDGEFKEKESCVALDTDKEFNVQFAVEINQ
ncbi:aldose 1-epimerase family protein [Faecalibacillus faecis]|uniref:aldose 1-epimerase family protein n=1 Tax=Faecalibacillus faecis TaxID=1982628 RepID=UPI0022E02B12|nr:aldose 1-epimerase family protein [Faecalibacillus faecis]